MYVVSDTQNLLKQRPHWHRTRVSSKADYIYVYIMSVSHDYIALTNILLLHTVDISIFYLLSS